MSSNTAQSMSEKERLDIRRFRHEISCAECKRLKLKCDRKTPCSSCTRRGCATICPYGTLEPSHQRGRMIVSDSSPLHQQIDTLGQRIKDLEEAVAAFSPQSALLQPHLLKIKFPPAPFELPNASIPPKAEPEEPESVNVVEMFGSLSIGDEGESKYFGSSAAIETLLMTGGEPSSDWSKPTTAINFMETFPFEEGSFAFDRRGSLNQLLLHLPTRESAQSICQTYLSRAWVTYRLSPTADHIWSELFHPIYNALEQRNQDSITSECLSLFFFILSLGSLSLPSDGYNRPECEVYFQGGRAALKLCHPISTPTTFIVQALLLNGLYLAACGTHDQSPSEGMDSAWCLFATAVKMAQTMGLRMPPVYISIHYIQLIRISDREVPQWHIPLQDKERRRRLWWDLTTIHVFTSISLGRPLSIHLSYVDTPLPLDDEETMDANCNVQVGYHRWRYEFLKEVVFPFAEGLSSAKPRNYSDFLELDKKLRQKQLPSHLFNLDMFNDPNLTLAECMKLHFLMDMRAMIFMHIHLPFFAAAYAQTRRTAEHKYFPSMIATIRCAVGIIDLNCRDFERYPDLLNRSWLLCNNLFTAALVTGVMAQKANKPAMRARATYEFNRAMQIFSRARSRRAKDSLAVLQKLTLNTGIPTALSSISKPYRNHGADPGERQPSDFKDAQSELRVLAGQLQVFPAPKSKSRALSDKSRSPSEDGVPRPSVYIPDEVQNYPQSVSAGVGSGVGFWTTPAASPATLGFDSSLFSEPSMFAPAPAAAQFPPMTIETSSETLHAYSSPPDLSGWSQLSTPQSQQEQYYTQPPHNVPSGPGATRSQGVLDSAFAMPMDVSELFTTLEWPSNGVGAYINVDGSWQARHPSG
ncbi:fungal-specific transcription factor domain-containing protein [Flagelloscypha sp. PMI_526]|nr:fungal-specific transcription factor domain-containing protein [Flagelloscypha sp. PMI_526]